MEKGNNCCEKCRDFIKSGDLVIGSFVCKDTNCECHKELASSNPTKEQIIETIKSKARIESDGVWKIDPYDLRDALDQAIELGREEVKEVYKQHIQTYGYEKIHYLFEGIEKLVGLKAKAKNDLWANENRGDI